MKLSKNGFLTLAGILIVIAFWGPFEHSAYSFVKEVTEKNVKFTLLVSEIKLILSGITHLNIPFISGHTEEITRSLETANSFLHNSSVIIFSQLILLSISKLWIGKVILLVLFALCLSPKTSRLSAKFLLLMLAINPGLSCYTAAVHTLSKAATVNFADTYLSQLEQSVKSIKNEKSQLIAAHDKQETAIKNGDKHISFFRKLKEDISYDFKRITNTIHGDYAELRLLIRNAGHEINIKITHFCTMILFCFLLLPLGYAGLVYMVYKNIFHSDNELSGDAKELSQQLDTMTNQWPIINKVRDVVNTIKHTEKVPLSEVKTQINADSTAIKEKADRLQERITTELNNSPSRPSNGETKPIISL